MALVKSTFGSNLPGWFKGAQGRPSVIVLQEWWGVTEEIKRQAEYISTTKNYRVLVPDLYKGKIGVTAEEGHHLMNNLDWGNAVKEIGEAVQHLKSEGAPKVGVVGFCMGGALSLLAAEHAGADAAISFYGTPEAAFGHPDKIKVPVQLHSGTEDAFKGFADPPTVKAWTEKVPGGLGEWYEYKGEGHAFMNSGKDIIEIMTKAGNPIGSKEAQDAAWKRVFDFFGKHLD